MIYLDQSTSIVSTFSTSLALLTIFAFNRSESQKTLDIPSFACSRLYFLLVSVRLQYVLLPTYTLSTIRTGEANRGSNLLAKRSDLFEDHASASIPALLLGRLPLQVPQCASGASVHQGEGKRGRFGKSAAQFDFLSFLISPSLYFLLFTSSPSLHPLSWCPPHSK